MASPRQNSTVRGTRVGTAAGSNRKPPREPAGEPEAVADPTRPRQVVNYVMQRRAALAGLRRNGLRDDVCDADPMLLRTAKYHGEAVARPCPVCRRDHVTQLTYTFSPEMGETSGRVRATEELKTLAYEFGAFRVYLVEVCQQCHWNHLVLSYVLGDGNPRIPAGRKGAS